MNYRIWDLHVHLSGVPGLTPEERAWADRVLGISETEPGTAA